MLLIDNTFTNPYFNIALEEYLFKQLQGEIFMLYCNSPSIIVGKHQNALAEVNYDFVRRHHIPVIRRISGGGTVYHDTGNLNYSVIINAEKGKMVDFHRYAAPVRDALHRLGLSTYFAKNNSLFADGLKISGNAEHVVKQRVLHHGTLLFHADKTRLKEALRPGPGSFQSRAVQSVRSPVANIAELLPKRLSMADFKASLFNAVSRHYPESAFYSLTDEDIQQTQELVRQKYTTDAWNFGYSPDYTYENTWQHPPYKLKIRLHVKKGMIGEAQLTDLNTGEAWEAASALLQGLPHQQQALAQALGENLSREIPPGLRQSLLYALMGHSSS